MAPNTILNPSIIAKAAVRIIDNELVMANRVYRGLERRSSKEGQRDDVGDTIDDSGSPQREATRLPVRVCGRKCYFR